MNAPSAITLPVRLPAQPRVRALISDIAEFPAGPLRDRLYRLFADNPRSDLISLLAAAHAELAREFEERAAQIQREIDGCKTLRESVEAIERQLEEKLSSIRVSISQLQKIATATSLHVQE